jgi:hypothetical protein
MSEPGPCGDHAAEVAALSRRLAEAELATQELRGEVAALQAQLGGPGGEAQRKTREAGHGALPHADQHAPGAAKLALYRALFAATTSTPAAGRTAPRPRGAGGRSTRETGTRRPTSASTCR